MDGNTVAAFLPDLRTNTVMARENEKEHKKGWNQKSRQNNKIEEKKTVTSQQMSEWEVTLCFQWTVQSGKQQQQNMPQLLSRWTPAPVEQNNHLFVSDRNTSLHAKKKKKLTIKTDWGN